MKQFFRITALSVLLFSSAGLVALTAQECGLSAEDVACLKRADNTRYAWLTPNVCEELSKVCRTVKRSQKRRDIKRVVDYIKKENKVCDYAWVERAVDTALQCSPHNKKLKNYKAALKKGDAQICRSPKAPDYKTTRFLINCPTFVPCPTMPPVVPTGTKQTVICNLGTDFLQACDILVENLWISGCIHFEDCGELVFSALEFGAHWNESCTSIISDPAPYRLAPTYDVFVDGIYDSGNATECRSNLVARALPISTDTQTPAPFIDFCVPADFDVNSPGNTEIDICFLVNTGGLTDDEVQFQICFEFRADGEQGFIDFVGTNASTVDTNEVVITAGPVGTFDHYTATACIPPGFIAPDDMVRLEFIRVAPGQEFANPVYATSLAFRYPRTVCKQPVGNCPAPTPIGAP